MKKITNRTYAALHLSRSVPAILKVGRGIVSSMNGNAYFPNPNPPLATVSKSLDDLAAAEQATQTRAKGTREARDAARAEAVTLLTQLKGHVQQVADADPPNAEKIITSASMSVRKAPVLNKADFTAKPGPVSGSVHLVARATRRASYEWQWSADGGKTWTLAPVTMQAKTILVGLPVAASCLFRFRVVTKVGEGEWSQSAALIVK